ncbi:MAG: hypothetical protein Kow0029_25850 [Candidatus Rifleibacteriota bacterium]
MKFFDRIKKEGFLGVAPDEFKVTIAAFAYIFFVICSYYVMKPIRGSLGMELGKDNIPVLSFLSMLVLIVSNALYSLIVGWYKRDVFIPFITRFFVVCIIAFWAIFSFVYPVEQKNETNKNIAGKEVLPAEEMVVHSAQISEIPESNIKDSVSASNSAELNDSTELFHGREATVPGSITGEQHQTNVFVYAQYVKIAAMAIFYLWVGVFALFAVTMFWSFMNDIFSVDQSKRLYAIIGYGGLLGGAVGSWLTSLLVPVLGTANLLLVACALLYPSVWCMKFIHGVHEEKMNGLALQPVHEEPAHPPRPWDGFLTVYRARILIFMALEMMLFTFTGTLFYQQLYEMINQTFAGNVDATTSFFADFFGYITILSLVSQFFLTKLLMMLPNPVAGLLIFPVLQLVASSLMLYSPSLTVVSWGLILISAINYSTGRALRELVYIPLDREQKYQGKGFIDTVVFRVGDGFSSIILIAGLRFLHYGQWLDWTILAAMAFQFYVIIKIVWLYAENLKVAGRSSTAVA